MMTGHITEVSAPLQPVEAHAEGHKNAFESISEDEKAMSSGSSTTKQIPRTNSNNKPIRAPVKRSSTLSVVRPNNRCQLSGCNCVGYIEKTWQINGKSGCECGHAKISHMAPEEKGTQQDERKSEPLSKAAQVVDVQDARRGACLNQTCNAAKIDQGAWAKSGSDVCQCDPNAENVQEISLEERFTTELLCAVQRTLNQSRDGINALKRMRSFLINYAKLQISFGEAAARLAEEELGVAATSDGNSPAVGSWVKLLETLKKDSLNHARLGNSVERDTLSLEDIVKGLEKKIRALSKREKTLLSTLPNAELKQSSSRFEKLMRNVEAPESGKIWNKRKSTEDNRAKALSAAILEAEAYNSLLDGANAAVDESLKQELTTFMRDVYDLEKVRLDQTSALMNSLPSLFDTISSDAEETYIRILDSCLNQDPFVELQRYIDAFGSNEHSVFKYDLSHSMTELRERLAVTQGLKPSAFALPACKAVRNAADRVAQQPSEGVIDLEG